MKTVHQERMALSRAEQDAAYAQECKFRRMASEATGMTAEQLAAAYAVCKEFGPQFSGIVDRADAVAYSMKYGQDAAEQVQELLTAVNPLVAARIMGWA